MVWEVPPRADEASRIALASDCESGMDSPRSTSMKSLIACDTQWLELQGPMQRHKGHATRVML